MASHYKVEHEPKVRVIVLLTQAEVDAVDEIGMGRSMPSRSAAIRYLLNVGNEIMRGPGVRPGDDPSDPSKQMKVGA